MTAEVGRAYDAMAERYLAVALDDLDRRPGDREWLAAFADLVPERGGPVADLGCGPGHVVHHLEGLGLDAVGYDVSRALLAEARRAFPGCRFRPGDLTALDVAESSLGGIVSRYSLIHLAPTRLADVFRHWATLLQPSAPVLLSFFAADSGDRHGTPFDHAVITAFELFPATVVDQLVDAEFTPIGRGIRSPVAGRRPLDHATILAIWDQPNS